MKKFLLTALCVTGLTSVASAANQYVIHDYDQVLGVGAEGIALNNACLDGALVRSIAPVSVCTELVPVEHPDLGEVSGYTEWVCKNRQSVQLVRERKFKREVCLKYAPSNEGQNSECLAKGLKDDELPATIKISIVTSGRGEAGDDFPGKTASFTFPNCAQD